VTFSDSASFWLAAGSTPSLGPQLSRLGPLIWNEHPLWCVDSSLPAFHPHDGRGRKKTSKVGGPGTRPAPGPFYT